MDVERRKKLLEALKSVYPNWMGIGELIEKTGISRSDAEKELSYLKEKGMIESKDFIGEPFASNRITALGIYALQTLGIPPDEKEALDLAIEIARYEFEKAKDLFRGVLGVEFDSSDPKHVAIMFGGGGLIDIVDKIYEWLTKLKNPRE